MIKNTNPFITLDEAVAVLKNIGAKPTASIYWTEHILSVKVNRVYNDKYEYYFEVEIHVDKEGLEALVAMTGLNVSREYHSEGYDLLAVRPGSLMKVFALEEKGGYHIMRLWHSRLIPILDGRRLCDLHMSCCNLRGKGWGKRNAAVGYLYEDPLGEDALVVYHFIVIDEMQRRGYSVDEHWLFADYCGKNRDTREHNPQKYSEAYLRNIPLQGHTEQIFKNDVAALIERGLPIELTIKEGYDKEYQLNRIYTVKRTDTGVQVFYGVRL